MAVMLLAIHQSAHTLVTLVQLVRCIARASAAVRAGSRVISTAVVPAPTIPVPVSVSEVPAIIPVPVSAVCICRAKQ